MKARNAHIITQTNTSELCTKKIYRHWQTSGSKTVFVSIIYEGLHLKEIAQRYYVKGLLLQAMADVLFAAWVVRIIQDDMIVSLKQKSYKTLQNIYCAIKICRPKNACLSFEISSMKGFPCIV